MLQTCRLTICPDTVLLFELRMRHPALRVIYTPPSHLTILTDQFWSYIRDLYAFYGSFKFHHFFQNFSKNLINFWSSPNRAISYRFQWNFACASVMPYYANEKIYSKFERMELTQIFTFAFFPILIIFAKIMRNFETEWNLAISYRIWW